MKYLHKYNKITGYWVFVRACVDENAQNWLSIFMADEPEETFMLSHKSNVNVKGKLK